MKHFFTISLCFLALSLSAQVVIPGCTDFWACNYNVYANSENESCVYCGEECVIESTPIVDYTLTVESSAPAAATTPGTVYRFYVNMTDASDRMSAIFGNNQAPLLLNTPDGAFNSAGNSSFSASGINPAFLSFFPEMADDTYATIGLDGPASGSEADPYYYEDPAQPVSSYFTSAGAGATSLLSSTVTGFGWYILNTASNGLPDADNRVLILQVTTTGSISGILNYQVFPLGTGSNQVQVSVAFDGTGTFAEGFIGNACGCTNPAAINYDTDAEYDDESCVLFFGCTDYFACNYNPEAIEDDGSCDYTCCPGPGCCSEGMYWDWDLMGCVITNPTDSNLDGCTDLNDLMDILSNYGDCAVVESEFTCGDDIEHEGYSYSTVQIGDQCWFSENCRYLPEVSPPNEVSETDPFYYVYDYQGTDVEAAKTTANYETYGVLYNWPAVMTEGLCPSDWHIPCAGEFTQLTDYLGGEDVAGSKMKEVGYDHWNLPNTGATNSSGFNGLPGGYSHSGGFQPYEGQYGYWRSSTDIGSYGLTQRLYYNNSWCYTSENNMNAGFSARCIKD